MYALISMTGSKNTKQKEEDEDESIKFMERVKTLQHVAIDLTNTLKDQNERLTKLEPSFQSSLNRILSTIHGIRISDPKRFRSWIYFTLTGIGFIFLIFIFFIA